MLTDKNTILQIIGSLMKCPNFLSETDKYNLQPEDFDDRLERTIFIAIINLYSGGAKEINEIDIDNYLKLYKDQYLIFEQRKGIEYLQDALDLSNLDNFEYYYGRLKKFNCLRDLKKLGYNISKFYEENELNPQQFEINQRFENLTPQKIFDEVKKDLYGLENNYSTGDVSRVENAFQGMENLVERLKIAPDAGARFQGQYFTTITRGARKGKYYIISLGSGVGKTRFLLGEACYLAYPMRFDVEKNQWKITGNSERTLFIATEQTKEEIQTMILAYLTGINEDVLLYGMFNEEQSKRIKIAMEIMKQYENNLHIVRVALPSVAVIKNLVRQNCLVHDFQNVFFDYIFSNPGLLNEFRDLKIREDVALLLLSSALKDLAVEQNVFLMSATQISNTQDNTNELGIKNQSMIRSAKSIIDKADIGMIGSLVSDKELELLAPCIQKYGVPNQVLDVYKVRRGRWTNLRIWMDVDLGTCRRKDLFTTNAGYAEIVINPIEVNFDENYFTYDKFLNKINCEYNGEPVDNTKTENPPEITITDTQVIIEPSTTQKGLFGDLI